MRCVACDCALDRASLKIPDDYLHQQSELGTGRTQRAHLVSFHSKEVNVMLDKANFVLQGQTNNISQRLPGVLRFLDDFHVER